MAAGQTAVPALRSASAIAFDAAGNLYIADSKAHQILEATLGGSLVVVAGVGTQGFAGDGGPAISAALNQPQGVAVGADGTIYFADTGNQRVRAVSKAGLISTVAGTGIAGFRGDGGPGTSAGLREPTALAVNPAGALLICDSGNHRLRMLSGGVISTVAGTGTQGFAGDGGPALAAEFDTPSGVALDGSGRIFLADTHNHRIRVLDLSGVVTTFAGTGIPGFSGDGGAAIQAQLSSPRGLAVSPEGDVLVAELGNERLRRVTPAGIISTMAGSGAEGVSADGAAVIAAAIAAPRSVAISGFGVPVLADTANATVRELVAGSLLYQPAALVTGRRTTLSAPAALTATYGQNALTASLSGVAGTPQGQVQATESGQALGTATLAGGTAVLDLSSLGVGTHTLTLTYLGDGLNPMTSASAQATVRAASLVATATSATMEYGAALPALTGVLSGVLPGDAAQVSAAFAAEAGDLPAVGSYPIVATLGGAKAGNYTVAMGQGSGQLTVMKASSSVALGTAPQAFVGLPFTLTANVLSSTRGQPSGAVQFLDGDMVVATGTLSGGVASGVYLAPPTGARTITLQYLGDGNFLPSTSLPTLLAVSALPDFEVGPSGSQTVTTTAGGTATYSLLVRGQGGAFTGAVTLSAAGLPAGASASFAPPQVVPGSGSATVTVTIQTGAPASSFAHRGPRGRGSLISLALVGFSVFGLRRLRLRRNLFCLLGASVLLAGCGARTVGEGLGGAVAQTYTLQVTGTGTNLAGAVVSHSVPLTLTLQQ